MDANELKNEVEQIVDKWFGALSLNRDPIVSPAASVVLTDARANLKRQLAAVFGSQSNAGD